MGAWESPIIIVSTGLLNTVNDSVIAGQGGVSGTSKFGGQLGKRLAVSSEQIAQMFSATIGTLFAGVYQYVQFASDVGTIVRGQLMYWDETVASNTFTVTDDVDSTTFNYQSFAGFALNAVTAGNYGFIQIAGKASGLYVASITGTKAIGRPVMGSVATSGRIDVIDAAITGATQNNFLGWAVSLPTNNTVGQVQIARDFSQRG